MEDDECIMFDEIPDLFGKMFVENENPIKSGSVLSQKTYSSLYEELCDKCFPERYMQPYDAEKVSIATRLYRKVLESKDDQSIQNELRLKAYKELGVKFEGLTLYNYLIGYLNPRLYLDPFLPDKLEFANKYYPAIEANKDDYIALEKIRVEAGQFIEEIDNEREEERRKEKEDSKNEEELAVGGLEKDRQWLEDIRNLLGEDNWRRYVEEEYGGYIND